jgi:hypothetical protein
MSQNEKQEQTTQAIEIDDLAVEESRLGEVKGGGIDAAGKTYYVGSVNGGVWK